VKEFRDSMLCKASTWLNEAKKTNGERWSVNEFRRVFRAGMNILKSFYCVKFSRRNMY
jgi:hypothetical protein